MPKSERLKRFFKTCDYTLVGLVMLLCVIGLIVIAVSMSAFMTTRSASGGVSDVSGIQQQAAYAMRLIGGQLRESGSLYLNLNPTGNGAAADPLVKVAFESSARGTSGTGSLSFDAHDYPALLSGGDSPKKTLTSGFRRYTESVYGPLGTSATRVAGVNCIGTDGGAGNQLIQSVFTFDAANFRLLCSGDNGTTNQPIINNVANFQVRYLVQNAATAAAGTSQIQYKNAADVGTDWGTVRGVEVCLVLFGTERVNMPTDSAYTDCDGTAIKMNDPDSPLSGARAGRMHVLFRNVFELRSLGQV
jgi:type IV pilus assembly protein PilW